MQLVNRTMQLTNHSHLGIAVEYADKTAEFLSSMWNIDTHQIFDYEPRKEELISGEPFKVRLLFFNFGSMPIELPQPIDNRSIRFKFIEGKRGRYIHHNIAFGVSNYDEMVSAFQKQNNIILVAAAF